MNNLRPDRKTIIAAVTVSVLLHIIVLSVLAFLKFSQSRPKKHRPLTPAAKINAVKKLIEKPQILPIPKIAAYAPKSAAAIPNIEIAQNQKPTPSKKHANLTNKELVAQTAIDYNSLQPEKVDIKFFGNTVSSSRLCFVVDCSGSMQGVFEKVKTQLKNSISPLEPNCYFEIIFFGDNRLWHFGNGRLLRASGPTKQKAMAFIGQAEPKGQTNAAEALTVAIKCTDSAGNSPEVIYFLTDGFDLDNSEQLAEKIMTLRNNYCPKTKINTIGFWPKPKDRIILTQVSLMSGGKFKTAKK